MHSLTHSFFKSHTLPMDVLWQLSTCYEFKGKQELWTKTNPEALNNLKELAIIQSVESSNRIEGVQAEIGRLRPLLQEKIKPQDRPEEELLGYKKTLDHIHSHFNSIEISPKEILKLHRLCQEGMIGDAGKWKQKDNEIVEIDARGNRSIRFRPLSAKETPEAMEQLCLAYRELIDDNKVPDLLVIASFVFDFLCIHPFRDGNGRVGRLLTLLLLYKSGYIVGAYISLERLIEDSKETYYHVLKECSIDWHNGKHEILPWWKYFLSILRESYRELSDRVELLKAPAKDKRGLIRELALSQYGEFTLKELSLKLPNISTPMVKKVLAELKKEKLLKLNGVGRGAKWFVLRVPNLFTSKRKL